MAKLLLPINAASHYRTVPAVDWIAKPWLVQGGITDLVGTHKEAGKTTWLMRGLLRSVLDGAEFLGQKTIPTKVLYLTEQPPSVVRKDLEAAGIIDHPGLYLLQWHDVAGATWKATGAKLKRDVQALGVRLVVVDTLPQFALQAGDSENDNAAALEALKPLQLLNPDGVSVIIVRHERKVGGSVAKAGRGATAFAGVVDIMLRIRRRGKAYPSRRIIEARSRFEETPEETTIDLTKDGYVVVDSAAEEAEQARKQIILELEQGPQSLADLVAKTKKPRTTLQRAIDKLLAESAIEKVGEGKRGAPSRFSLKGKVIPIARGKKDA